MGLSTLKKRHHVYFPSCEKTQIQRNEKTKPIAPPQNVTILLHRDHSLYLNTDKIAGTPVKIGEKLAVSDLPNGADIICPINGTISCEEEITGADGKKCRAITIEANNSDDPYSPAKMEDPLLAIKGAGIVTETNCHLPVGTLLQRVNKEKKGTIIVRCLDVDPHLYTQQFVANNMTKDNPTLVAAIDVVKEITANTEVVFAIDKRQKNSELTALASSNGYNLCSLDGCQYPSALAPFLINKITANEVALDKDLVPISSSVVLNLSTLLEIGRAVTSGQGVLKKHVTIRWQKGHTVAEVPVGTKVADIISSLGIDGPFKKIIIGGPLTGMPVHTIDYPVTPATHAITLESPGDKNSFPNLPCINCGLCAASCPSRLIPGILSRYIEYGQIENAWTANVERCVECGCCAYVCPSGRSMVQYMQLAKSILEKENAEAANQMQKENSND